MFSVTCNKFSNQFAFNMSKWPQIPSWVAEFSSQACALETI